MQNKICLKKFHKFQGISQTIFWGHFSKISWGKFPSFGVIFSPVILLKIPQNFVYKVKMLSKMRAKKNRPPAYLRDCTPRIRWSMYLNTEINQVYQINWQLGNARSSLRRTVGRKMCPWTNQFLANDSQPICEFFKITVYEIMYCCEARPFQTNFYKNLD